MTSSPQIYGYARVSTANQAREGNSLPQQTSALIQAGVPEQNIYTDAYTGTKLSRPNFSKLLTLLRPGDRLVITKLDRFARTTSEGITTIQTLLNNQVSVHILNMGLIDNTPTGKLITTVLLAFAEFERDMIVERTTQGKAQARLTKPDFREGRPSIQIPNDTLSEIVAKKQKGLITVNEACRILNISRSTWYNLMRCQTA